MKIFGYLKNSKTAVVLILLLLVVQAFCDLSLPSYTSEIVDVGIQQSGVANAVPSKISAQTLKDLELFMAPDQIALVKGSYQKAENNTYELSSADKKTEEELNQIFAGPMLMVSETRQNGTLSGLQQAFDAGQVTKDQILEQKEAALSSMGDVTGSILDQKAVLFVRQEYESLGIDLGDLQTSYMLATGGKMLGVPFLGVLAAILVGLIASRTAARIGVDLRGRLFKKVLSFSNTEMDHFSHASLITRNTNDVQQIQMVMVMILRMVLYAPVIGIGGIIIVANTKTGMGWIIAVAVITILIVVSILMKIAMPRFKKMQTLVDKLNLVSREILTGLSVIRAFSREKHEEERFGEANQNLMKTQLFTNRVMTFMMPTMMMIMQFVMVMIVWFGSRGADMGNLQVGDMMAFITYTMMIVMAFMMITMVSIMLPRANVAAGRIEEVLSTEPVLSDHPAPAYADKTDWNGTIKFDKVSFRFPGADQDVLENIDFPAKPGQTTAIIGSTGSGKSTLVNLIPRLYDVTEGSIQIDGVDIRKLSQEKLHDLIGFVPQKGILFSGDIESNLKFGGEDITDEAMMQAAEIAQATEFIKQKPEQYNSPISQGGSNVSGGQKQRLSIARAIAKNPKIFVFDDSFSALDYKTDVVLRRALNEKVADATVLIVAQRISTILRADQIIVLNEGKIVGIGTHRELLESCATYQEIARSQLSEKELDLKEGDANE